MRGLGGTFILVFLLAMVAPTGHANESARWDRCVQFLLHHPPPDFFPSGETKNAEGRERNFKAGVANFQQFAGLLGRLGVSPASTISSLPTAVFFQMGIPRLNEKFPSHAIDAPTVLSLLACLDPVPQNHCYSDNLYFLVWSSAEEVEAFFRESFPQPLKPYITQLRALRRKSASFPTMRYFYLSVRTPASGQMDLLYRSGCIHPGPTERIAVMVQPWVGSPVVSVTPPVAASTQKPRPAVLPRPEGNPSPPEVMDVLYEVFARHGIASWGDPAAGVWKPVYRQMIGMRLSETELRRFREELFVNGTDAIQPARAMELLEALVTDRIEAAQ